MRIGDVFDQFYSVHAFVDSARDSGGAHFHLRRRRSHSPSDNSVLAITNESPLRYAKEAQDSNLV